MNSPRPRPCHGIATPRSRRLSLCPKPRGELALQRFCRQHLFYRPHRRIALQFLEKSRGHWRSSRFGLPATRYLPIVHLGRLCFELFSCLVRVDIFSDPEPLCCCIWYSPFSCLLRIWPSAPCSRRFKAFISSAPPTYSWVQAGRPTTSYHTTPHCTEHHVAFNRDPTTYPPTEPPLIITDHWSKASSPAAPPYFASSTSTTGTHCRAR